MTISTDMTKGWKNRRSLDGNSNSTYVYTCDVSNMLAVREALLGTADATDGASGALLKCMSVETRYGAGSDDPKGGVATIVAEFVPAWKVDALDPTKAFKIRYNYSADGFTYGVKGPTAQWASGAPIGNRSILPRKVLSITEAIIFGVRSTTPGLNTYGAYQDKVNSDTFLGVAAGFVIFKGATVDPFQLPDGTFAWKHQITVAYRSIEWNKDYNEDTGAWEICWPDGKNPKFGETDFALLIATPA